MAGPAQLRRTAQTGVRRVLSTARRAVPDAVVERVRGPLVDRLLGAPPPAPGQPTFSIVIPLYESPIVHLTAQLDSIAAQTYPHFECILVDDGSPTTAAADLADAYAERDARFRVIRRPDNGGIAAATNDGLDAATNDWIVFSDHDDRLMPSALAAIATHIVGHPDDDVIYTDEQLVDEDGEVMFVYRKPDFSRHRFTSMNYFCHIVTMRRSLVEEIGRLDPAMEPSADRDFNLRATERAHRVGHIPDILYEWRAIDGSVAKDLGEKAGVKESTLAGAAAHLERTGQVGTAIPAPHQPYLIRVERPPAPGGHDLVRWHRGIAFSDLDDRLRSGRAERVVFHHVDIEPGSWIDPLASLAALDGVGAAAPRLATADGRLVSGGHIHHPAVMEIMPGLALDDPGPWGVYQVDHEVAGAEPDAIVFDRTALDAVGGFSLDELLGTDTSLDAVARSEFDGEFGIDLFVALVCTRLWQHGTPIVWSPLATIEVDDDRLHWGRNLRRRAASRRLGASLPDLLLDPYSPIEIRR
ncbi:MAG: glycosyltransferase [Actinomycetota bacterium]